MKNRHDDMKSDFIVLMKHFVSEQFPDTTFEYDEEKFALQGVEGRAITINLGNIFRDYRNTPEESRQIVLQDWVGRFCAHMVNELPSDFEEAGKHLRLRVRQRSYLNQILFKDPAQPLAEAREMITIIPSKGVLPDHLFVELVYDSEDAIASIKKDRIKSWGQPVEFLQRVAMENTLQDPTLPGDVLEEVAPGLYVSSWRNCYDLSILLNPNLLSQDSRLGESPIVIPFSRDMLVVVNSEHEALLDAAYNHLESVYEEVRVESVEPLIRTHDGGWRVCEIPPQHPAHSVFRRLHRRERSRDYAEQNQNLTDYFVNRNQDIFLASIMLADLEGAGESNTLSVWTRGVHTLLPKTEYVALLDPEERHPDRQRVIVSWEALSDVAGSRLKTTPYYPPLYEVMEFPDAAMLDALSGKALELPERKPATGENGEIVNIGVNGYFEHSRREINWRSIFNPLHILVRLIALCFVILLKALIYAMHIVHPLLWRDVWQKITVFRKLEKLGLYKKANQKILRKARRIAYSDGTFLQYTERSISIEWDVLRMPQPRYDLTKLKSHLESFGAELEGDLKATVADAINIYLGDKLIRSAGLHGNEDQGMSERLTSMVALALDDVFQRTGQNMRLYGGWPGINSLHLLTGEQYAAIKRYKSLTKSGLFPIQEEDIDLSLRAIAAKNGVDVKESLQGIRS